jgi:hypothetical protein
MSQQFDNTNRGLVSKNERKEKDTHPDYKGSLNVEGVEYWLDGWIKVRNDGTGKFLSLSVKRKDAQAAKPAAPAAPAPPPKPAKGGSGFDDMDDSIPF